MPGLFDILIQGALQLYFPGLVILAHVDRTPVNIIIIDQRTGGHAR